MTAFTPAVGGPVTQTVSTNAVGHATTSTLDPAHGVPLKSVDQNDRVTEIAYDALGRAVEVWQPNRSRATGQRGNSRFEYVIRNDGPVVVKATTLGPNGNYRTSNTLYDGLLRPRQVQAPATGGGRLLTDTRYDTQGRAYKTTEPYFNSADVDDKLWVASDTDVASLTRVEFDGAGREVAEITFGGARELWRATTSYGGDRVHVTPPEGGTATTTITDARGQTVELRQYKGGEPTGDHDATTYTYTPDGRLASTRDPAGNVWRNTYDLRGNGIKVEDADKGTSTMTYDAAGQVTTVTDARGNTLTNGYDLLGRRTSVKNRATTLAAWTYDTAVGGKGHLASSTRYVGGAAYDSKVTAYTPLYQPSVTTVTIPDTEQALAGKYTTTAKFNPDGSPYGEVLPAIGDLPAENVNHGYGDLGNLTTMSGAITGAATQEYVTSTEYTRYGEVARIQLGETGKRVWQSFYYDTHTRRLKRSIVDAEVTRPMQKDVNYAYDRFGNITSVADTPQEKPSDVQCFRYDHLRRLTEAWTPEQDCGADPTVGGLKGAAPYWQSFSYDKVGNRLTETRHAAGGDTVRSYAYPAPGAHALKSVTTAGPSGERTDEFSYDATGNTTARGAQRLDWDEQGKLAKLTEAGKSTEFVYDADGNRLIRRDATGRTLYLDGQELKLDTAGKLTGTRYYEHGEHIVAMRTAAGLTWLATDHQDTAQVAIASAGQEVTQRRQAPFGAPRGEEADFPGEKGFVGGTKDASTGLTNLGARLYDTALGRFISVDPMMDLSDPQQMHGYTYSNNNPITHADPTGLFWDKIGNAFKKIGHGIATFTKYAAPALGAAALIMGTVATGGVLLGVVGGLALAASAVNTIHACTGGGSGVDCAMEAVGMVPGVGKLAAGAGKYLARRGIEAGASAVNKVVHKAGEAADKIGVFNGGGARARSLERYANAVERTNEACCVLTAMAANLGRGYTTFDNTVGYTNLGWSSCGIAAGFAHGGNCLGLPNLTFGQSRQPFGHNNQKPFVPTRQYVYPHNFIGPILPGHVRAPAPPAPLAPAPPPPPGKNYTTKDGRLCNTGSRMCAS